MLRFYYAPNTYLASVEGKAILNIRFGYTCFGFGTKKQIIKARKHKWYNPFPIRFTFNAHTGQSDMIKIFDIGCRWLRVWYKTKGDATSPEHHRWEEKGLHVKIFNKTF